jgi:hypothetical protein
MKFGIKYIYLYKKNFNNYMKHIRKFESFQNKLRRQDIIKESVIQVDDLYKVRTTVDIPQSLINAYVKKVKENSGKNLRQYFGDVDIAEEIVKYLTVSGLDVEKIPGNAILGGPQAQTQQGQIQQGQAQTGQEDEDDYEDVQQGQAQQGQAQQGQGQQGQGQQGQAQQGQAQQGQAQQGQSQQGQSQQGQGQQGQGQQKAQQGQSQQGQGQQGQGQQKAQQSQSQQGQDEEELPEEE